MFAFKVRMQRKMYWIIIIAAIIGLMWFNQRESFDVTPQGCAANSPRDCNSCSGNVEGRCVSFAPPAIWNSRVYGDGDKFAGGPTDGKARIFKMPNYYGWGHPSIFHYGEPYYMRSEKY